MDGGRNHSVAFFIVVDANSRLATVCASIGLAEQLMLPRRRKRGKCEFGSI
jgi:hypothetical protein